ncbi:MAG TPA: CGNR zinc finger domain-containing protein [Candidatus Baltobacteraceae bacterium]|nr:CGNR zinc finger domain-containing protein [Candidatus Baltobacteraceae bacterium]
MSSPCSVAFAGRTFETGPELADALVYLDVLSVAPAVRAEDLASAATLRDVLARAIATAVAGGTPAPRDVATLNSYAADEPPMVALSAQGTLLRVATDPVRCALSAIARDGIEVIARRARDLRRCEGCGAHFLDDSRGQRRRWCSMDRCGNRAKVAGYRARRRR